MLSSSMIYHIIIITLIVGLYIYISTCKCSRTENMVPQYVNPWDTPEFGGHPIIKGSTQEEIDAGFQQCIDSLRDPTEWLPCCESVQKVYGGEATECSNL